MAVPRSRLRRWCFRLLAVGLGLVFALALLEVALRIAGWPAPGLYVDGRGPVEHKKPTEEGGYGFGYRGEARLRHYDFDVPVWINAHGFFERDPTAKAPGEYRIGLFGDSITAGWGVRAEERYPDVWLALVRDRMPEATLYNLATPGTGTWHNQRNLRQYGPEYDFDEIVLAFYSGNDLSNNLDWVDRPLVRSHSRGQSIKEALAQHVRSTTFLWYTWQRVRSIWSPYRLVFTEEGVGAVWSESERALDAMRRVAGSKPFTIWYVPYFAEWDDEAWRDVRERDGLPESARTVIRDRVAGWCAASGVRFVDLTPLLAGRRTSDLQFPIDRHWNAEAHRIVGEGLARLRGTCDRLRDEGRS